MEKFAVDLDAVLDEFEFHEDQVLFLKKRLFLYFLIQAEKKAGRHSPSVTGFFSPLSEEIPPTSALNSQPENNSSTSHNFPSSVRYDLPPAKQLSSNTSSASPKVMDNGHPINPPLPVTSSDQGTNMHSVVNLEEQENISEKENVDPNNSFGKTNEIESVSVTTEVNELNVEVTNEELSLDKGDEDHGEGSSPPCYDQAMSLMEEMRDL